MKMHLYINGVGSISRLDDFDTLSSQIIIPNYKELIPAMKLRRMSRVMRMSNYAALMALKQAQIENPEAINIATAYGCLTDTEKFLSTLIANDEEFANPSAFINSTHNTLAGSLAILIGAKGQNFTFVHPQNAFENALLDASIGILEGSFTNALVGGVDEKIELLESLYAHYSDDKVGEGAAFIAISKEQNLQSIAKIDAVKTLSFHEDASAFVKDFLANLNLSEQDIDLVLGNEVLDSAIPFVNFKSMTDEYPTATAQACVWGAEIIKRQRLPQFCELNILSFRRVLIFTKYKNDSQSLILLSQV